MIARREARPATGGVQEGELAISYEMFGRIMSRKGVLTKKEADAAAEERAKRARQLEAEAKRGALQKYIDAGFSPESIEADRPQIRARLAAEKIAGRRKRAASPHAYMDGSVPGGRSENLTPPSQG